MSKPQNYHLAIRALEGAALDESTTLPVGPWPRPPVPAFRDGIATFPVGSPGARGGMWRGYGLLRLLSVPEIQEESKDKKTKLLIEDFLVSAHGQHNAVGFVVAC